MLNVNWEEIVSEIRKIASKTESDVVAQMESEGYKYEVYSNSHSHCDYLYDICGGAIIKFRNRKNRVYNSYKKYLKEHSDDVPMDSFTSNWFYLAPCTFRQELKVNKAVASAIVDYLNAKFQTPVFYYTTYVD